MHANVRLVTGFIVVQAQFLFNLSPSRRRPIRQGGDVHEKQRFSARPFMVIVAEESVT